MLSWLQRFGLARLVRLIVTGSIPPLWYEIVILHFRGSFHNRAMWIPVVSLPPVFAGGITSILLTDEKQARSVFRPLAWWMMFLGTVGTVFHVRGVGRQMGGFYNWWMNLLTGPPIPAPPQMALSGLLGILATTVEWDEQLTPWLHLINIPGYWLLASEAGYEHWKGSYFNKVMFVPVTLAPLLAIIHLSAVAGSKSAKTILLPLSATATIAGLIGFGFHLRNIHRRPGGFRLQNYFYGPPVVAPLQMTSQGILGLLIVMFEEP